MKLRIGTAGYSYKSWVGGFYPPGTRQEEMLPYYARHFPVVEINSTFYRPPTVEQAGRMGRRVPDGFGFTLKVPRSASHEHELAELPAFKLAADAVAADGKLLGLMVQFPESFHDLPANRHWLVRIRGELWPHPLAVEFRHVSWDTPELPGWVERHGLDLVGVAVPPQPRLFPAGPRLSGRRFYARLHTLNAANWYAGGAARYDFDFPEEALQVWAEAVKQAAAAGAESGVIFFNNCVTTQAIENARRLMALVEATAEVEVVRPPRAERGLFDDVP